MVYWERGQDGPQGPIDVWCGWCLRQADQHSMSWGVALRNGVAITSSSRVSEVVKVVLSTLLILLSVIVLTSAFQTTLNSWLLSDPVVICSDQQNGISTSIFARSQPKNRSISIVLRLPRNDEYCAVITKWLLVNICATCLMLNIGNSYVSIINPTDS